MGLQAALADATVCLYLLRASLLSCVNIVRVCHVEELKPSPRSELSVYVWLRSKISGLSVVNEWSRRRKNVLDRIGGLDKECECDSGKWNWIQQSRQRRSKIPRQTWTEEISWGNVFERREKKSRQGSLQIATKSLNYPEGEMETQEKAPRQQSGSENLSQPGSWGPRAQLPLRTVTQAEKSLPNYPPVSSHVAMC